MENEDKNEVVVFNTDKVIPPPEKSSLIENRTSFYDNLMVGDEKVTVFVLGYNRLEKTKNCVESILRYTKEVPYKLVLLDNGSTDSTLEYFKTVRHPNKLIAHITKNLDAVYAFHIARDLTHTKYAVIITNDVIVTKNWLSNLLICMESDPTIGFVAPVSTNISNYQEENLGGFSNLEQMQRKAEKFNVSDPTKWEERMRLINIVTFIKKEVMDTVGIFDLGFFHDFGDDDYSTRVRRGGYKLIVCRDTFVHHDHDFRNMEDKDPVKFQESLMTGRESYKNKYHGIDAWIDINNYELELVSMVKKPQNVTKKLAVLGIDVKCGTPVLTLRNKLRSYGAMDILSSAFTTDAKYYFDLQTVVEEVNCDRMLFLLDYYAEHSLDYIILGEPINLYEKPIGLLEKLLKLLKPGGHLLLKLRNTYDVRSWILSQGLNVTKEGDLPVHLHEDDFVSCVKLFGVKDIQEQKLAHELSSELIDTITKALTQSGLNPNIQQGLNQMRINEYLFCIQK